MYNIEDKNKKKKEVINRLNARRYKRKKFLDWKKRVAERLYDVYTQLPDDKLILYVIIVRDIYDKSYDIVGNDVTMSYTDQINIRKILKSNVEILFKYAYHNLKIELVKQDKRSLGI